MRYVLFVLLATFAFTSCRNEHNVETVVDPAASEMVEETEETTSIPYPAELEAVFEAHGGLAVWNRMNNLCFEMEGRNGTEIHTTNLNNRKTKIEHKDWSIGYDGEKVWLLQNKENAYTGNARFYHNLMFYFYAMPFVLSDDGIVYSEVAPTELDGTMYNGIKIRYEAGVGDSPEDEYVLYYDKETHNMAWLGYTVTYRTGEESNDWHYIKYDDWQEVNGLLLPEKLTWYNVENNLPTDERNDMKFEKITVSPLRLDDSVFAMPDNANVVQK